MGTQVTQDTWNELVGKFLKVEGPPGWQREKELASCLPALSHWAARQRVLYDQRQVLRVVEHCVNGVVDPRYSHTKHAAQLLSSALRWPGVVRLSPALSDRVITWLGQALDHHHREGTTADTVLQVLRALAAVLRDHPDHSDAVYISLCGREGSLVGVVEGEGWWQNKAVALQCLHLLTYATPEVVTEARQHGEEIFPPEVVSSIQRVVIGVLRQPPPEANICPHKSYLHLVASALSVLYNLVICAPNDVLGNIIVSACRPFIFYGLPGFAHAELLTHTVPTDVDIPLSSGVESDSSGRNYTNRNRRKRLRRKRAQPSRSTTGPEGPAGAPVAPPPAAGVVGVRGPPPPPATALHTISLKPEWTRSNKTGGGMMGKTEQDGETKTFATHTTAASQPKASQNQDQHPHTTSTEFSVSGSETDCSDLEGGGVERESALMARVRQCALQAINAVIDKVGRQDKFSYWAPLMCPGASLMTCVLRDPAPSARMAALQVINTFLLDSAQVLSLADDSESGSKGSYSTLGHQLGASVRELHRCLARALLSERVPGALVRTLKTAELLVQNVNYSKLRPGLLTKLVTHVKYFMTYKEAVVRANAFSVMVSVLMVKPRVEELRHLLLRHLTPAPPSLAAPPTLHPQPTLEEHLPSDEDDELEDEVERLRLTSEDDDDGGVDSGCEGGKERKTMVSWLVRRCVDSLLSPQDTEASRGIYIQVQLQSLKVLSALVSEHLSLIQPSLPLIQHVITVCSEAGRDTHAPAPTLLCPTRTPEKDWRMLATSVDIADPSLTSPDPGTVVEHTYTLLGALLGAVKVQPEWTLQSTGPDTTASDSSLPAPKPTHVDMSTPLHNSTSSQNLTPILLQNSTPSQNLTPQNSTLAENPASAPKPTPSQNSSPAQKPTLENTTLPQDHPTSIPVLNRDPCPTPVASCLTSTPDVTPAPCLTTDQIHQLWLWALQGPLQPLFKQAELLDEAAQKKTTTDDVRDVVGWRSGERARKNRVHLADDQVKQMAAMATVLSQLCPSVMDGIGELWTGEITKLLQRLLLPTTPSDLRLAGMRIMSIGVGFPAIVGCGAGVGLVQATTEGACRLLLAPKEDSVNRDRLLAAWALANITSVLDLYSDGSVVESQATTAVLPLELTEHVVESGLVACRDKDKIKPHGVRCVGNVVAWALRTNLGLPTVLLGRAVEGLVGCATSGSNMKTRWNACHALGSILAAADTSLDHQPWRSQVLSALSRLVEGFKNYKVRIQACNAVSGVGRREGYGAEYLVVWGALLRGLDAARGIPHFQEARHRDDLVNQICQGLWQLTVLITLEDAGALCETLQVHQDVATPLLHQAYHSLPPERTSHALKAQARVEELLGCDALTEDQQSALTILESLTVMTS